MNPESTLDEEDFNTLNAPREDPEYDKYDTDEWVKSVDERAEERRVGELNEALTDVTMSQGFMSKSQAGDNDAEIDKQLQETWLQLDQDEQYINQQVNDDDRHNSTSE